MPNKSHKNAPDEKRVIYTVIVNNYDRLQEPTVYPGWDYVCFTDGKGLSWRAKLGLSKWKIRYFDGEFEGEELGPTRYSRLPKILPHRYLPDYDYSAYVDGYARFTKDPSDLLYQLNWPDYGVGEHRWRDTVFEEFEECIEQKKAPREVLEKQQDDYTTGGLPQDAKLLENGLLFRRHNDPAVIKLNEAWWTEMITHSFRDQLSLPYVAWKQGFVICVIEKVLKHTFFTTKAHYRSLASRLIRSVEKRWGDH